MIERPKQRNCQIEPPYPGEPTVVMALADPEWVAHERCEECPCEYPHMWDRCGRARVTKEERTMRAFASLLMVGGVEFPLEKFEFKIDYFSKYGVIAPPKFPLILPIVT